MLRPPDGEDPVLRYVAGSFAAAIFLPAVAGGVTFPALPRLEFLLGLSSGIVGLIVATADAVRLLSNAPVGSLLDRVGTRRPLLAGLLSLTIAPFAFAVGLAPDLVPVHPASVFFLGQVAAGLGSAFILVGGYAMITDLTTPENRGTWLGYMFGSYSLGFPVGLFVGGLVADAHGIQVSFLLAGGLTLLSLPVFLAVIPDRSPVIDRHGGIRDIPALVRADRRLVVVGTVNGVMSVLSRAFLTTVVLFTAKLELEIGELGEFGVTGVILTVSTLSVAGSTLVAGRYSDSVDERMHLVLPALLVLVIGFATVGTIQSLHGIVAGSIVAGIGGGAVSPTLRAYLGDISPPADVAKLGGAYDVCGDIGAILGPILGLTAASRLGFPAVYLGSAGLSVLTAILVATTLLALSPWAVTTAIE